MLKLWTTVCRKSYQEIHLKRNKKKIIDRLLLEKISLAGIARVTDVSEKWLQDYVNAKYDNIPKQVTVAQKKRRC